jgi:hypothetical protein
MRLRSTVISGAAALLLTGALGLFGPAAPAGAGTAGVVQPLSTCQHFPSTNKDPGYGHVKESVVKADIHDGPNAGCTVVTTVYARVVLYYHCFVINSAGHGWTHVRIAGSPVSGWIWNYYLDDGGSNYFCA